MDTPQVRRAYRTLDGMRGVGAFIIVMRHVPGLFGPVRVPESFLAVDLFYLVSGFVVAHAYGERMAAGGFAWDLFKTRLIRLYPLYLIGLAIGALTAVDLLLRFPGSGWTPLKIAECFATGLLMLPRFPAMPNNGSTLDGPIWTLLYELIANMVYALTIRILNIWVIAAIMIVSAAGLVAGELTYHTLDIGYNLTDQWAALARVGFSFFAGVLIYRISDPREHRSTLASFACVALLGVALAIHLPHRFTMAYELAAVIIGGPLLLFVAARLEPEPISGRLFTFVGLISYGIYLIHQPLGNLVTRELNEVMDIPEGLGALWFGAAFLAFVIVLAWALDRFYDAPVRKVLRAWLLPSRPAGG